MSKRIKVATGVYQRSDGYFEVSVQPHHGARSSVFAGRFTDVTVALAYRAACQAANDLRTAHCDPDLFALFIGSGLTPIGGVDPDGLAPLWCDDENEIDARVVRRILRGAFDQWDKKSHDAAYRKRIRGLFADLDHHLGAIELPLERNTIDACFDTLVASGRTQQDLKLLAWLMGRTMAWAVVHRYQDWDPVAGIALQPESIRTPGRTLQPGSLASDAIAVLQAHPGQVFTARDIADVLVAQGRSMGSSTRVSKFATKIGYQLRSKVDRGRTYGGLCSPSPRKFCWDPVACAPTLHALDVILAQNRKIYLPSEMLTLASWLPPYLRIGVWLQGLMGLRTGEMLGLKVEHLDPSAGLVRVRTQCGTTPDDPGDDDDSDKDLKTIYSVRNLPLPPTLLALLVAYVFTYHGPNAFADPEQKQKRLMVLHNGPKANLSYDSWALPFGRAATAAGLHLRDNGQPTQPYDLRHSVATLLTDLVSAPLRARWLGHQLNKSWDTGPGGGSVTISVYTQVTTAMLAAIAGVLDQIIITEMDSLVIDDSDLDVWVHTNDLRDTHHLAQVTVVKVFGKPEEFHDPRRPRWTRAYRRDHVARVLADLDARPAMSLWSYARAHGLKPTDVRELGASGVLEVTRRAYRTEPGGQIHVGHAVTIAHPWRPPVDRNDDQPAT